jgi:hypothetical protein
MLLPVMNQKGSTVAINELVCFKPILSNFLFIDVRYEAAY